MAVLSRSGGRGTVLNILLLLEVIFLLLGSQMLIHIIYLLSLLVFIEFLPEEWQEIKLTQY